ncbi:hypothetical protein V6N11_052106 [Hibiscus sabdariffa]|uniref:Uncharacterized protein n=1 Tax=Hibiscus sabdariffa TaxID=183260 RepID=A0ABR2U965_9ROSI
MRNLYPVPVSVGCSPATADSGGQLTPAELRMSSTIDVGTSEDDDVHLLDVDDVDILKIVTTEGNSLNVEDDVWIAVVARLGLVNEQLVWGFVQTELIV